MFLRSFFSIQTICLGLAACATQPQSDALPASVAGTFAGSQIPTPIATVSPAASESLSAPLSLQQTLAIAFQNNPEFEIFEAHLKAARAEVVRALAYPNPEVEASLGLATSRDEKGKSGPEFGLRLAQPLESPLKRRTRRAAAEALEVIDEREHEVFELTLRAETTQAFFSILYYARTAQLAEESKRIADEIRAVVENRIESGEAPELDRIKARVETLKAARSAQAAQRSLASSRAVLNALCGGTLPSDFQLADSLDEPSKTYDFEEALKFARESHPALALLAAEIEGQHAVIAREKAAWRPDPKPGIQLGRGFGEDTAALSLGIEIPIGNRNQGGISSAQANLERLEAEHAKKQIEIARDVQTAIQHMESAREQVAAFEGGLRAGASEALRIETVLYEQGETNFLQLLDARRTAQETESEYLQAVFDLKIAQAELERATGKGEINP